MDLDSTDREGGQTRQKRIVAYIVSQELVKVSSLLPSNRQRSAVVHNLIRALGLFSSDYSPSTRLQAVQPVSAARRDLALYHTAEYLDFVLEPSNSSSTNALDDGRRGRFSLEDDCPVFAGLPEYVQLVAGGSLTAAATLKSVDVAIFWDGGRHHAQKDHASGYCYVADCILAVLSLKRLSVPFGPGTEETRKARVMYLDLDLHFSDAVSQAFYSPHATHASQILTLSIHHSSRGFFPASTLAELPNPDEPEFDPYTLSFPLKEGASDSTYATIWQLIEYVKDAFQPDVIVVQCGVDALAGDPCAISNWSLGGKPGSLGWCLDRVLHHWQGKKLLLGGGGYNSANAARAWAYITSIALDVPLSLEMDIPDHPAFPLYAPSFTLNVEPGNMPDRNKTEYLETVRARFEKIILVLKTRMSQTGPL